MRKYEIHGEKVILTFPYDASVVNMCRGIPNRRFNVSDKTWEFPLSGLEQMKPILNEYGFTCDSEIVYSNLDKKQTDIFNEIQYNYHNVVARNLKLELKEHQIIALCHSLQFNAFALFMQERTGKTPTALAYIVFRRLLNNAGKALIIVEKSNLYDFKREIEKFTYLKTCVIRGTRNDRIELLNKEADIYILNYDGLRILTENHVAEEKKKDNWKWIRLIDEMKQFDIVILDESQNIKNLSHQTRVALSLSDYSKYRLILTGTPVMNQPIDVYYQYAFLDKFYLGYNTLFDFKMAHCIIGKFKNIVAYKKLDVLQQKVDKYSIRILRKDVIKDLPEKVYREKHLEMTAEMKRQYKQMQDDLMFEIENSEEPITASILLVKILRLAEVTSGHYLEKSNPKLDELENIIDNYDDKIVVWCRFRKSIELVENMLSKKDIVFKTIHGDVKPEERTNRISDFNTDKDVKVIILQFKTGAVGIDLSASSKVVFFENQWQYGMREQCESRNFSIIKEMRDNVEYIDLVVNFSDDDDKRKSIDTVMLDAIKKKKSQADFIVDKIISDLL